MVGNSWLSHILLYSFFHYALGLHGYRRFLIFFLDFRGLSRPLSADCKPKLLGQLSSDLKGGGIGGLEQNQPNSRDAEDLKPSKVCTIDSHSDHTVYPGYESRLNLCVLGRADSVST